MRRKYIHDLAEWPRFEWDMKRLAEPLAEVRHQQGRLIGQMEALGFNLRQEAILAALTEEVIKSSEIEGERLDLESVRSSIARRLGIEYAALKPADRDVEGVVEMMLDATRNYQEPLTRERLFSWHAALFPTGRSGMTRITVGAWRDDKAGPMRVVSGAAGREKVHFEAPEASRLKREMRGLLDWFNSRPAGDGVAKAALAHLWFVTVHPFEDGNGRMARAIANMALARSEATPQRFYSMSAQIREERGTYYAILEQTQKGSLDITGWMDWFFACLGRAIAGAQRTLAQVLAKKRFWDSVEGVPLNERQRGLLNRMLEGFEGKLTSSKWAKLTKCSQDTALRDIQQLLDRGILVRGSEGGRSTGYTLRAA